MAQANGAAKKHVPGANQLDHGGFLARCHQELSHGRSAS
jgi:hypothetical protein